MRTGYDALRSIARYLSESLGDDWEVRLFAERGMYREPFARVEAVGPATHSGPAIYADTSQAMAIQLYPAAPSAEVEEQAAEEALLRAERLKDDLFQVFRVGGPGGFPLRVPLYDYDGVPFTEDSTARNDHDFLRVEDFSATDFPDPEDRSNVAVVCDLRVSWRRPGRVPFTDTQPVRRVTTDQVPSGS